MSSFEMVPHPRPNILDLYAERGAIQLFPVYQRISGVWDRRKRRLLIDSIVNGVDLPKIYFHELNPPRHDEQGVIQRYAVVDGKQRLESIFEFLEGNLSLPDDFRLFEDASVDAAGLDYEALGRRYPRLRARFDTTDLPIVVVRTDDTELIEELFSRLNEAVVLTAPEYRNTLGGPLPRLFRELATHPFFVESLPFETGRHRYLDLAAKFVYLVRENDFQSTKKQQLDRLVRSFREGANRRESWAEASEVVALGESVDAVLERMHCFFRTPDQLLGGIGWVTLFFHLFRIEADQVPGFTRELIEDFVDDVTTARAKTRRITQGLDAGQLTEREQRLAHFDSHRQSPNDGSALRTRYDLMRLDIAEQCNITLPSSTTPA